MAGKIKEVNVDELLGIMVSLTDSIPNYGNIEFYGLVKKTKDGKPSPYVIADPERGDTGLSDGDEVVVGSETIRVIYPK